MPFRITLGQFLHDCSVRFGERPCITMAPSGETLSYAGLKFLVNGATHGFRDGIAGGRLDAGSGHVAVMLENGIPHLAMFYALKKIDIVEVSINRAFRGSALAGMINLTSCETLLANRDDHIVSAAADTDIAVVMFTSGTTGVPKGCLLSHR